MPRVHKRKYEKIDQAEIDLVVQCTDSHEFYERYREEFPSRKKGIDSISKIWKRRGEFIKKQIGSTDQPESVALGSTRELENLLAAQTRLLTEIASLVNDQLSVSREILTHIQKTPLKGDDHHSHKTPAERLAEKTPEKPAETKEPVKKSAHEKPRADIMIGS